MRGAAARELVLVAMLAMGHTTDRVAHELNLSRHTVGEEISALLGKFGCKNRAELVAYWYVHELLPVGVWPPPRWSADRPGLPRRGPAARQLDNEMAGMASEVAEMFDALEVLRDAGCPVDQVSDAQRAVLASLSPQEAVILASVQQRLRAVEDQVVAHELKLL